MEKYVSISSFWDTFEYAFFLIPLLYYIMHIEC